jgi:serine/threonine protein phosphatase 1
MGGLFFAHAGIDPARPLDGQQPKVLTRIRDRFLSWTEPFPERVCVVHGHSIDTPGVFNGNRIAVDSGCFETGCLTAAEIVGDRVRFLMTAG